MRTVSDSKRSEPNLAHTPSPWLPLNITTLQTLHVDREINIAYHDSQNNNCKYQLSLRLHIRCNKIYNAINSCS